MAQTIIDMCDNNGWQIEGTNVATAAGGLTVSFGASSCSNIWDFINKKTTYAVLDGVSVRIYSSVAADAVATLSIFPDRGRQSNLNVYLCFTVVAALDYGYANMIKMDLPITFSSSTTANITWSAEIDDTINLCLWGHWLAPTGEPPPMPVSLEGYKWPLTRTR